MLSRAVVVVFSLLGLSLPAAAQYDDEVGGGTAVVIQNRRFKMAHELTLQGGVLPLDAFAKGITATGRYTLHFDDFHAWEIGAGTFAVNVDTGLKDQLINVHGVEPESLAALQLTLESNYVMKPFYGKVALFNQALLYAEVFVLAGITMSYWTDDSWRPGPDVGIGARFFVSEWFAVRADIRHAVVFNGIPLSDPNATIDGVMYLGVGASFNVGY